MTNTSSRHSPLSLSLPSSEAASADQRASVPNPLVSLAMIAAYVALEWLSFLHEHDGLPVTPWNPGLGLMLALIILWGRSYALVLFAGVLAAEVLVLRTELPVHAIVAVGAIVAGTYGLVAEVARRHLRLQRETVRTFDIVVLVCSGLGGAIIVSGLLSALLLSINFFDVADVARTALPLVLGDVIGIAVVTPLVVRAYSRRRQVVLLARPILFEGAMFAVAIIGLVGLTIWWENHQQSLSYLLFLPVMIAAVRHGIDGVCAALAILQLVLVAMLQFHGFDLSRFTDYQLLMLVLTLTGLVVGALVSERHAADERARLTALKLEEARAQAARAARLNLVSGMAAVLAHEVNQPMTAARALARSVERLLEQPDKDLGRAAINVRTMVEQIDLAGAIIRRMREFVRRGEPHFSTLDLATLLAEAVALVQPFCRSQQIGLTLTAHAGLPQVFADRVQIQQVVINFVRNAVEAIKEVRQTDGAIAIAVQHRPDICVVEISVTDNGPGIALEQAQSVFEPLHTTRTDGIGLGLSISKSIVEAHGGRIWLASSIPGRTEFRFTLPAAVAFSGTVP